MFVAVFLLSLGQAGSVPHYVSTNGAANSPYLTWADAATQIQWAVDTAVNGETVWVSNGIYTLTNQITITNVIILQSMNGCSNTIVDGNYPNVTSRCFYVACGTIDGFTITNGYVLTNDNNGYGGGVYVDTGSVYNCQVVGNTALGYGGGMYLNVGTSLASTIKGNVSKSRGGGIYGRGATLISNCLVMANTTTNSDGGGFYGSAVILNSQIISNVMNAVGNYSGGGLYLSGGYISNSVVSGNNALRTSGIFLNNCLGIFNSSISNNTAGAIAGGITIYVSSAGDIVPQVRNCKIINNYSPGGVGGIWVERGGCVRQCLIKNNGGSYCGGALLYDVKQVLPGYLDSCTIMGNTATNTGGGIVTRGTNNNYSVSNCVVWGNTTNGSYASDVGDYSSSTNSYWASGFTCANYTNFPAGRGNITNNPQFVDFPAGDYRLAANSPCLNAGTNQNWMTNAVDFDGRQRIRYGIVDMGAYETIYEGTIYKLGF